LIADVVTTTGASASPDSSCWHAADWFGWNAKQLG
jgi:hypothetical protein